MTIGELGWIDWGALTLMLFLVVQGLIRGCSGQLGRLFAMVAAAALAYYGFKPVLGAVLEYGLFRDNIHAARLVALVLVMVAALGVWLALRHWLTDAIGMALRQPFDATPGGVRGGVKAFIMVTLFCTMTQLSPDAAERGKVQEGSRSIRWLAPLIKHFSEPES